VISTQFLYFGPNSTSFPRNIHQIVAEYSMENAWKYTIVSWNSHGDCPHDHSIPWRCGGYCAEIGWKWSFGRVST
jgi:hypothetical protein